MKLFLKILMWIVILLILFAFFFLPTRFPDKERTVQQEAFCEMYGCGVILPITPFEYLLYLLKTV